MPNYIMGRSYHSPHMLDTQDLLTAVKTVCNYEGDLYVDNRLVMSCLGLSRSENTRRLLKYGITSYVNQRSQCWTYRYTDPSKNIVKYYVNYFHYQREGKSKIDFTIKEYPESEEDHISDSLASVMEFVRNTIDASPFPHNVEEDIYVKMFAEDGLIYFAARDWQTSGEPELYILARDGHQPEYGAKYYLQKRYETLQPKFGGYEFKPAVARTRGLFEIGDVVLLKTTIDDLMQDGLYLITEINSSQITIRDLDNYEVKANVMANMIAFPLH